MTDTLAEQELLEAVLEETKPAMPEACKGLDYLLATPLRYRPYPHGSRFRRARLTPGVWYGAEKPATAMAEMVFYRLLFYAESPDTPFPDTAAELTAFAVELETRLSLDLTAGTLAADAELWENLESYDACQNLAENARAIDVDLIRYKSVRDPEQDVNVAVLSCRTFSEPAPVERQTWRLRFSKYGAQAICEHPRSSLEFSFESFEDDTRLAGTNWERSTSRGL